MAEKYKSVLEENNVVPEKYNESLKPRLPTAEEEAIEPVYPEEYLIPSARATRLGINAARAVGSFGKRVLSAAEMALRPAVKNKMVMSKGVSLKNSPIRMPNSDTDITHAYRNMSQAEYDAAKKSGYFERNPNPKYGVGDEKWWSGGDELGKFGREWKNALDSVAVRVPKSKLPEEKAVRFKDVEKMKRGGKVKVTASSRADGIAQRGKTRGRMV